MKLITLLYGGRVQVPAGVAVVAYIDSRISGTPDEIFKVCNDLCMDVTVVGHVRV
jgi:hypothetical protein